MSDTLASQLSAFKRSLKRASATLPEQKRVVKPSSRAKRPLNDPSPSKRPKRVEEPTAAVTTDLSLRLMTAVDVIKAADKPIGIHELEAHMNSRVDPSLLKVLTDVDRIKYDPVHKTLEYLSLHNIKTADDLLKVLRNQSTFQGLSVKQLRDGWNGCLATIEQLEKENKIIVHKTKKENSPRHIWLNVENLQVGGDKVDPEFCDLWSKVPVPKGGDLIKALVDNGRKPTSVDPDSLRNKKAAPIQRRKQKKPRRGKITNIHMKGILKDYSERV